jgi:hypothetical protein
MEHGVEWTPGIGDPTVMGWLTVVAYFVAAWLCLRAFKSEKRGPDRPYRQAIPALVRVLKKHWPSPPAPARRAALWLVLAFVLGALGVNKQLDLQTLFTEIGRSMAVEGGWYESRRIVQAIFIAMVLGFGAFFVAVLWWLTRGQLRDFRLTLFGFALLVSFVVIRAMSFHHVDIIIGMDVGGVRVNWMLELGGLGIVIASAAGRLRRAKAEAGASARAAAGRAKR